MLPLHTDTSPTHRPFTFVSDQCPVANRKIVIVGERNNRRATLEVVRSLTKNAVEGKKVNEKAGKGEKESLLKVNL